MNPTAACWQRYTAMALSLTVAVAAPPAAGNGAAGPLTELPRKEIQVQGLTRGFRLYRPESLPARPVLLVALHGAGGDGQRFRLLTNGAFERLADEHGVLVVYPDAIGGRWHDCRARAAYQPALAGIDDIEFLDAVTRRAGELVDRPLAARCAVGYSNGGHLVFRLAQEAPTMFDALAVIAAHLPVLAENDCRASGTPVSLLLISGTEDAINAWSGSEVRPPLGLSPGHVLSAKDTAAHFRGRAGITTRADIEHVPDLDTEDGTRVVKYRWDGACGVEILLMAVKGGGHSLPGADVQFPEQIVGRTSRDLNGPQAVWELCERRLHMKSTRTQSRARGYADFSRP